MIEPGRKYLQGSNKYRFGFNGKEKDNEVKGEGNQHDYGMRIYDPRLAKFLSVDPLTKQYPHYTPYSFAGNKPIAFIDRDGEEEGSLEINTRRREEAYLSGKISADQYSTQTRASGASGLIAAGLVFDFYFTKGMVTRFLFTSVFLGHLHHNGTKNPVEQEKRANDLINDLISGGTGFVFGKILVTTISILRGPLKEEVSYLFRGTTAGFEGSKASQSIPITPTSSDPGVATIFSIAASKNGKGILQIALPSGLGNVNYSANVLTTIEKEIGVGLKPVDFAAKASITITTEQAKGILSGLGINLPSKISLSEISKVIKETSKLSQSQISEFYKQAAAIKNP